MKISCLLPFGGSKTNIDKVVGCLVDMGISDFWLRDLPVTREIENDFGSLLDPYAYSAYIYSKFPAVTSVGVAVTPVGSRTPAIVARAAQSICDLYQKPFRLGLGASEKPSILRLYGIDANEKHSASRQFIEDVHHWLQADSAPSDELAFVRLQQSFKPELWVASNNEDLVRAVSGFVAGWMSWFAPPSRIKDKIEGLRLAEQNVAPSVCLNIFPSHDSSLKPATGLKVLTLEPHQISQMISQYNEVGVREVMLQFPVDGEPSRV